MKQPLRHSVRTCLPFSHVNVMVLASSCFMNWFCLFGRKMPAIKRNFT